MFGTLVVTLPSAHRGGELRISHVGREVTLDASATEFSELSYVAFYADCEHEALPIRAGNRICLVARTRRGPYRRDGDAKISEVSASSVSVTGKPNRKNFLTDFPA